MPDNLPRTLNCPACGAPLEYDGKSSIIRCKFCNNVSIIPGVQPVQETASTSSLAEIRQLAESGNLIEAIKRYREIYNVGLAEAKEAVEALQAGRVIETSERVVVSPASEDVARLHEEIVQLLKAGKKLEALKRYREFYDVSLARAESAVGQLETGQTTSPEAEFPAQEAQPDKTARRLGWLLVAILLFVGGIIALILVQPGGPFVPRLYVNGPALLLSSAQDTLPDLAAAFYNPDKDAYLLGVVAGGNGKLLWKADLLPNGDSVDALAQSDDLVYAASGTNLLAYHKTDGSLAWQASMPDKLYSDQGNLLVSNGRVITYTLDQSVQAYDAGNGQQVWSRRMAGYDRTLRMVGNSLLLLDYIGDSYDYSLVFLDPGDGSQQRVITPTCQYDDNSSDTLDTDSGIVYDQGKNALFLAFGFFSGCVQRLDLASGQITWQAQVDNGFEFAPDGFIFLMTDSQLYFSDGNQLRAVDKATGTLRTLVANEDYEFLPLTVTGNQLIVRARWTRGTERFELWGLNASSGDRLWQTDLGNAAPIDPPNEMSGLVDDTDTGWTWRLVPEGLMLLKFQAAPNQLVLETLNPADGTNLGEKTVALKKVIGDFYSIPTIIGGQGSVVYMVVDTNIYVIDLATGKVEFVH